MSLLYMWYIHIIVPICQAVSCPSTCCEAEEKCHQHMWLLKPGSSSTQHRWMAGANSIHSKKWCHHLKIFSVLTLHTPHFLSFFFCKADGIYLSSRRLLLRTWKALYMYIHMYFSPIKSSGVFWDRGEYPVAFHVFQNSSTWDRNYIIRPLARSFDGGPLPPSVYLGRQFTW